MGRAVDLLWAEHDRLAAREAELSEELLRVRRDKAEVWTSANALEELGVSVEAMGQAVHITVQGRIVKEPQG